MESMERTSIYLTKQQRAALTALGGEGLAARVRDALDLYLALINDKDLTPALAEAVKEFDDVKTGDFVQLIRRTVTNWAHNREQTSNRAISRRIEAKVDRVLAILEGEHDTDHG